MHCYRCGRRVPDRSPRCENCGQKFSYGNEPGAAKNEPPPVVLPSAPADPAVAAAVVPLGSQPFEMSSTVARKTGVDSAADPTIEARLALHDAASAAVKGFGENDPIPMPEPTDPDAGASARAAAASMPLPNDIAVGKTLSNRLEIVAELGSGPLGRCFKAIDRKKGSIVAVKAIPASRLPEEALSGRFAETIALVKALVHPNLVKVYGAGREADTAFTIEQYLEGLPLRALLDVKRENGAYFTFEEAEPIITQICQGLSFAHTSLVHGGIKPENVILHVDSLKIVDLGLSRLFSPMEWHEVQVRAKNGGAYLAPEYGQPGAVIDKRADVYSVGAILYEMLTGRAPSGPESAPVSSLNPSVPRAVDRVVSKAMSRLAEGRYSTAGDLKEAVLRVLGGDILADDLESPVGDLMETFVDPADADGEPGIEIEYLSPGPLKSEPSLHTGAEEATPVGAIELHEPLWEPDEIAENRTKSDPEGRRPRPTPSSIPSLKEPAPANPGAAVAREFFAPRMDPAPMEARSPGPTTPGKGSRAADVGLSHGDHLSVDLPMDTVAGPGAEATSTGTGAGPAPRSSDWLDVKGPIGIVAPARPVPPPPPPPAFVKKEDSVLELDLPPVRKPAASQVREAPAEKPTIRRDPPRPLDRKSDRAADRASERAADRASERASEREREKATDPPRPPYVADRPSSRSRVDVENPTARALSSPVSPKLDLDRPSETRPMPPKSGSYRKMDLPADPAFARPQPVPAFDAPVPRPTFVVRRKASRAPLAMLGLVLAAGSVGGGWWFAKNHVNSFVPVPVASCPAGMVAFGSGVFPLGSEKLDPDRDVFDLQLHKVDSESFCIDKLEYPNKEGDPPLVNVTITQAETACAKEGKRLCTENEWERACKGPLGTRFPYGDNYKVGVCNLGSADTPGMPKASGSFPACGRPDGMRDMSGNVWEITSTGWLANSPDGNPGGPVDANTKVIKGGSAKMAPANGRCASRDIFGLGSTADDVGFRCCSSGR